MMESWGHNRGRLTLMSRLSKKLPAPQNSVKKESLFVEKNEEFEQTKPSAVDTLIISDPEQNRQPQRSVLVENGQVIPMHFKENGEKDYGALARLGHDEKRLVQASFTDLLPRDLTDAESQLLLKKPDENEIERQLQQTQDALNRILAKNTSTGGIKTVAASNVVKFTAKGDDEMKIVKVVEMAKDPFDPPKFSHKRAPKPPPSPPPPVLHSPPRKVSAVEQKSWYVPPCISNWKNAKGYTIALDKRLAADGRGLQEHRINEGFSSFAESLYLAEKHAREEVEKRALVEKKLAEKQRNEQEETLRTLAQKAREEKAAVSSRIRRENEFEREDEEERDDVRGIRDLQEATDSKFGPMRVHGAEANLSLREREELRRQMSRKTDRDIRLTRMSDEQRAKYLERTGDRDVSERIALAQDPGKALKGLSSTTKEAAESVFDQRLFDQTAGIAQGLADDESYNVYDKPLFAGSAVHLIYRPKITGDDALDEEGEKDHVNREEATSDAYGRVRRAPKAFQGAEESRSGPVEFEKDESTDADPFGLNSLLSEAKKRSSAANNPEEPPAKKR